MRKTALGLIETYGYTGAIEAADVCLKAANVSLVACKKVRGGLVTIEIIGDVGAVKAAIDSAEAAVPKVGKLISTHVIPRPADGLDLILDKKVRTESVPEEDGEDGNDKNKEKSEAENENNQEKKQELENKNPDKEKDNVKDSDELDKKNELEEKLWQMKVVELRSLARDTENIKLSNNDIKYARKEELVDAIIAAKEGSDE